MSSMASRFDRLRGGYPPIAGAQAIAVRGHRLLVYGTMIVVDNAFLMAAIDPTSATRHGRVPGKDPDHPGRRASIS
jgi:hypothetical protein